MDLHGKHIDWDPTPFGDLAYLEGERVESTLGYSQSADSPPEGDAIVLTDRRLICLLDSPRVRSVVFFSLADVAAVRVASERPKVIGGFLWCALALLASLLVLVAWEQTPLDILASAAIALMGLYLLWERLTAPPRHTLLAIAGGSHLAVDIHRLLPRDRLYEFVNEVFAVKRRAAEPNESDVSDVHTSRAYFVPG